MTEEGTSQRASIAKAIAWPLVVVVALLLFRSQIENLLTKTETLSVGSLSFKRDSKLGENASPEVLKALAGLSENSIFTLISRNLAVTCFAAPVNAQTTRDQHAQLIQNGLLEEIGETELKSACGSFENPTFGVRITPLGERARGFQLRVLSQFSNPQGS